MSQYTGTTYPPREKGGHHSRQPGESPPLDPGDRLSRAEFERRYHAHPEFKKAELIEGVVYMPSPGQQKIHSRPHARLVTWLGTYWAATPGIVEVAASSAAYDLHDKLRVYARSGVLEYIAVQMVEQQIDWFVLREGVYEALQPDESSVIKSEVFPGLWLDTAACWSGDLAKMLAVLQEGLASSEHAAFLDHLQKSGNES